VPPPLLAQLAPAGRLLIPLGERGSQTLTLVERHAGGFRYSPIGGARFVPLLGEHGFDHEGRA
jgi:protein-L-isoaspartate(D-aspartate) O-methyltransferase